MRIEPISSKPYVYNTNQVDATSMNRVPPVPSDINQEKTDFTELAKQGENTNPLRPGESKDFGQIVDFQMAKSQRNAERVMAQEQAPRERPAEQAPVTDEVAEEETAAQAGAKETASAEATATATKTDTATVNIVASEDGTVSGTGARNQEEEEDVRLENYELQKGLPGKESVGQTVFANVIPHGLDLPYTNAAVEAASTNAEEENTEVQTASSANTEAATVAQSEEPEPETQEPANLYQLQRANAAYTNAMAMGL